MSEKPITGKTKSKIHVLGFGNRVLATVEAELDFQSQHGTSRFEGVDLSQVLFEGRGLAIRTADGNIFDVTDITSSPTPNSPVSYSFSFEAAS
jgi:hypothetical protein